MWTTPSRPIAIPATGVATDRQLAIDEAGDHALVRCDDRGAERRCLVDLATGRLDVLAGTTGDVGAISGDGTRALTASEQGGYLVWDVATHTASPLSGDRDQRLAGLSRDGALAVIGVPDSATLVDLDRGTTLSLRGQDLGDPILFSPDRRTFLDASGTIVDVESGEARHGPTGFILDEALRDHTALIATTEGVVVLPDELPWDPRSLAARLARLPYELDARDAVVAK